MARLSFSLVAIMFRLGMVHGGLFDNDFHVVSLTPDTFMNITTGSDFWIIMMYAPWCGHCQMFAPKWSEVMFAPLLLAKLQTSCRNSHMQAATALAGDERVHVGAIDCIEYQDVCNEVAERLPAPTHEALIPCSYPRGPHATHGASSCP